MAATPSNPIIFYDIDSTLEQRIWSPNTWKARLALNYKRLPYRTIWLSLPDIEPTLRGLGLEPLSSPLPFTLPVIVDPAPEGSGKSPIIVRDSLAIAQYLDVTYPDPERVLFPGGTHALQALLARHVHHAVMVQAGMGLIVVPLIPKILDEKAIPYFLSSRQRMFGKPVPEVDPKGAAREAVWASVKAAFDDLDKILQNNDQKHGGRGGDFVLGDKISFADFALVGLFLASSTVNSDEDGAPWDTIKAWNGGRWERLMEACKGYTQVV